MSKTNGCYDKPCCGNCKFNRLDIEEDEYVCDNPESDGYACTTFYNERCECYERSD